MLVLFHVNSNVHCSNFLTLWRSPCSRPFSVGWSWRHVIHTALQFLYHRDLAGAYIRRLGNVPIPSSMHFSWLSVIPGNIDGHNAQTKLESLYKGLNIYVALLQRLEDNENMWLDSLTIFNEESVVGHIYELQNDLLVIGCLLKTTIEMKPRLEMITMFDDLIINNDVATGSIEGYFLMTEFRRFLENAVLSFSIHHTKQI
ncbi:hypothetical protein ACJMK2_009453 [Sinanodonta woodiana]|uniref:Uncharacterized protein n=1 Tax=Sinanodonta woodiana TaxID=1069815 RepID=A0ABD3VCB1_SINWO